MGKIKALIGLATLCAAAFVVFPTTSTMAAQVYIHAGSGWRGGYWRHGWYGPRFGWWWVVGPSWYYYSTPVYPYPYPYTPPVVVVNPSYPVAPQNFGPAPIDYWYYCRAAKGYYPYVPTCPGGWEKVPATPPPAPHG
ncbi:MAG: hypothetical protein WBR29_02470 [Gammaproteobacteria bacterium]